MGRLIAGLAPMANCIDIGAYKGDILVPDDCSSSSRSSLVHDPLPQLYGELVARFPEV